MLLGTGAFLAQGAELSWAAPGQSPAKQTVPTKPDPTPVTVPGDQPAAPGGNENNNNSGGSSSTRQETTTEVETAAPSVTISEDNTVTEEEAVSTAEETEAEILTEESVIDTESVSETEPDGGSLPTAAVADLSVAISVDSITAKLDESVTFTIEVKNDGPANATEVFVSSVVPNGFIFNEATASQGLYNNVTGLWDIGAIALDESVTLEVNVTPEKRGIASNEVEVAAVTQADPDSTPNNGIVVEDDHASLTITVMVEDGQVVDLQEAVAEDDQAAVAEALAGDPEVVLNNPTGWIYWLVALSAGVVLVVVGLVLVRRS
ncbi:MAG: hypothetical protein R3264_12670 [Anaerolineae bacterium]|nr:hypothetical protein [Anaerolineae bacterium]